MPNKLTPLLNVADVAQSVAFYRDLGFEVTARSEDAGGLVWVSLAAGGARLMLNRQNRIGSEQRRARPHIDRRRSRVPAPARVVVLIVQGRSVDHADRLGRQPAPAECVLDP